MTPDSLSSGALGVPPETDQHGNALPAWLVPARDFEPGFTLADLEVLREIGTKRAKGLIAVIDGLRASLAAVSEERDAAKRAFRQFGDHLPSCSEGRDDPNCDCGFHNALARFYPAALPVVEEPSDG